MCVRMSVMSTNKNSCFLQNQFKSPGLLSHFVMTVKWGYEWRYLIPGETAGPMEVGTSATITAKLIGLITKRRAPWGAISGICWFRQSSRGKSEVPCWQESQGKSAPFPVSSMSLAPDNLLGKPLRMWEFGSPTNSPPQAHAWTQASETGPSPSGHRPPARTTHREPSRWAVLHLSSITLTCREIWKCLLF